MILNGILGLLAFLSLALLIWQWLVARRFPLHRRVRDSSFAPAVTLLKSLKGADASTEDCLRSWFNQQYDGDCELLFGVASPDDPVCDVVRRLIRQFPSRNAELIVCGPLAGPNAKASKLAQLLPRARHDVLVISDADVRVPPDLLANVVAPLRDPGVGLVNCLYRLANPVTPAMRWEAVAINSDFWSQVLQSRSLKPLDFALGAVMAMRRGLLDEVGGFAALASCLADDYQLGNRIAGKGHRIELCPVVAECWDPPMTWRAVWKHQLRWARTIRVSQPLPYFFSILSNPTLWPLLWLVACPAPPALAFAGAALLIRMAIANNLQSRLTQLTEHWAYSWMTPIKDLLQTAIWFCSFAGNRVEWRGRRFSLIRDGTLVERV